MMVYMLQAAATACNGLNHLHSDAKLIPILVDNCCFKCITNNIKDLMPTSIKKTMKMVRIQGWRVCHYQPGHNWDDDQGLQHIFLISNSYFIPQATSRLLCPQHWAQEATIYSPIPHGTGCNTNNCCITLYWVQQTKKRTVSWTLWWT